MGHSLKSSVRALLSLILALLYASPVAAQVAMPDVHAELVAATARPAPGSDVPLAIVLDPGRGWHIYWQNPGDSGYPPRLAWTLPGGALIGAVRHPVPTRMAIGGVVMNVHQGRMVLLAELHVPATLAAGMALPVTGSIDLLVCSDQSCVPQTVALSRDLVIGDGHADPAASHLIAMAREALPAPMPGEARFSLDRNILKLRLPIPAVATGNRLELFPTDPQGGVPGEATIIANGKDGVLVTAAPGTATAATIGHELVVERHPDGTPVHAFTIEAVRGDPLATMPTGITPGPAGPDGLPVGLVAFAGAVLGGLILNLMPCVFPILSLKAMALVRSGAGVAEARAESAGYLAGAMGTMMALGAAVLALRAGGEAVGWAFQLQNTAVVAGLLVLVSAIAFNLAGLFELPSFGLASARRSGFAGGLGTGALAAFVATPCTGPFMAGALGAALVLPAIEALAVFAGLGLGLALPFVVIGLWEPARRRLPRPGAWMNTLRHFLSIPMFATALGLAWLVGQQGGVGAMTIAIGGVLLLGLALWWAGARQRRMLPAWPAMPGVLAALGIAIFGVGTLALTPVAAKASAEIAPYSARALADLRARHRPVLVFATAEWCLTCKVNEATSLDIGAVRHAFRQRGAVLMEADWTRSDPEVTRLLTANGRAGVPLYMWYPANGAPQILPQVLTPDMVTALVKS